MSPQMTELTDAQRAGKERPPWTSALGMSEALFEVKVAEARLDLEVGGMSRDPEAFEINVHYLRGLSSRWARHQQGVAHAASYDWQDKPAKVWDVAALSDNPAETWANTILYRLALAIGHHPIDGRLLVDPDEILAHAEAAIRAQAEPAKEAGR